MHFSRSTIQSRCVAANQPCNDSASPKTTYLYYTDEGYAAEYTHNGNHPNSEASITPTLSQLYLFAPQGLWSTEPVAIKQSGDTPGWRYPETDHLGTPHGLISKAGEETTDLRANAFGQTEVNGESLPLRFAGQTEDDETESYYNFHRDYEPGLGRYRESDPIGLEGGVNQGNYAESNPLRYFDNYGLYATWTGTYESMSGGIGLWGAGFTRMQLHTECREGEKCFMTVWIVYAQGGISLSPLPFDLSMVAGNTTVLDNTLPTTWEPSPAPFNNVVFGADGGMGFISGLSCGVTIWGPGAASSVPSCDWPDPETNSAEGIVKTPGLSASLGVSYVTSFGCIPCCD